MAKKLYVGNLPYDATNSQLQELFSKAGTVESASVIMDNFSGRSKGFGFVEMSTDEGAAKAIEMFKDYDLGGRQIVVNEARPKTEHRSGGGFRGNSDRFGGGGYGGGGDRHSGGGGYGGGRDRRGGGGGGRRDDRGRRGGGGGWGDRGR